jgi:hypothetical protein
LWYVQDAEGCVVLWKGWWRECSNYGPGDRRWFLWLWTGVVESEIFMDRVVESVLVMERMVEDCGRYGENSGKSMVVLDVMVTVKTLTSDMYPNFGHVP